MLSGLESQRLRKIVLQVPRVCGQITICGQADCDGFEALKTAVGVSRDLEKSPEAYAVPLRLRDAE